MARRFDIPAASNPFENAGLDREIVNILAKTGDHALLAAVKGLQRAVAKSLHPDVAGPLPDSAREYYDGFIQATSKIDELPSQSRLTFAKAYASRGAKRVVAEKEVFESIDFHDGAILSDMAITAAEVGESAPSLRGTRLLVRPLNFDNRKPAGTPKGYDWIPPEAARVGWVEIDESGDTNWEYMRQSSITGELQKQLGTNRIDAERKELTAALSSEYWPLVAPLVDVSKLKKDESVWMLQRNGTAEAMMPSGEVLGRFEMPDDLALPLDDGLYRFGFDSYASTGIGGMYDPFYVFEGPDKTDPAYVIGFADKEFVDVPRRTIYADHDTPTFGRVALPSTAKRNQRYSFTVPEKMTKFLQRTYTPRVPKFSGKNEKNLVVAADTDGTIQVMGGLILASKAVGGNAK